LIHEKSPYLLQHAHNPVDWYPWGEEAFKAARETDKPIFLSIGYSTCHWCHVMERESFEDEEVAEVLNAHFVPVKVDREERPDVDRVYMSFVTATTGSGGWPMSVFLTPELQPFFGGTYFPPRDSFGRPGFKTLLYTISGAWNTKKESLRRQGVEVLEALQRQTSSSARAAKKDAGPSVEGSEDDILSLADQFVHKCYRKFKQDYDEKLGGFGEAPKFPRPVTFQFLFACHQLFKAKPPVTTSLISADSHSGAAEKEVARALEMACFTLEQMTRGGIYDHLGGGFHRYSVDTFWHVPHFEKMLYDQGQLLSAYSVAYKLTGNKSFERVVRETIQYLLRDMRHPEGGFYSAEDADSAVPNPIERLTAPPGTMEIDAGETSSSSNTEPKRHPEKREGAFYVWREEDLRYALLNAGRSEDDVKLFERAYGITSRGNIRRESDPHGELKHTNHLFLKETPEQIAESSKGSGMSAEETRGRLDEMRRELLKVRSQRPRPHLDDKVLTAWNALVISGLVEAAEAFDDESFYQEAVRAARFVIQRLYREKDGMLLRSFRGDKAADIEGFLEDYAFFIRALLDLHQYDGSSEWLQWAENLQQKQNELFYDKENGGYFTASRHDPSILLRLKMEEDSAEPSGNSVACSNLTRLALLLNNEDWNQMAIATAASYDLYLKKVPNAIPEMLRSLAGIHHSFAQIIILGRRDEEGTRALIREARKAYQPFKSMIFLEEDKGGSLKSNYLVAKRPHLMEYERLEGKPTAFVCKNFSCQLPVTDPNQLRDLLSAAC
jgi:uncharacterized protein YyaL (SSP411 family)